MFLHITDVECLGEHRLRLTFDDGSVRSVDLGDELDGPVFEPLRDAAYFRQVRVNADTGTVEWPNGADFAPEFLYEKGTPDVEVRARKVAEGSASYGRRTGPRDAGE
jgi:hypothetical protein